MMINVERLVCCVAKAEIDEARFGELRKSVQDWSKNERTRGSSRPPRRKRKEDFRNSRARRSARRENVATLKPALSPARNKQFEEWRNSRNMFGGGRRGGPGGSDGGGSHSNRFGVRLF